MLFVSIRQLFLKDDKTKFSGHVMSTDIADILNFVIGDILSSEFEYFFSIPID